MFYSLDMGGTNFRVVTVTLSKRANRVVSMLCCRCLWTGQLMRPGKTRTDTSITYDDMLQGDVDMRSYPFTPDMKKLPVEQLFDCMAAKLAEFAHECGQDPTAKVCI